MRRLYCGYTIVEAMIVLAVSGVILSAAMLMFRGQQGKTEFTQSMRDIDSKIQSIAKDTASGVSSTTEKLCSIGADERPNLSVNDSSGVGTNSECIFLGKAIEVNGGDTIKIYTVLGKRDASSFSDANPTPIGSAENYTTIGGSTVLSSKTSSLSGSPVQDSKLVGIYLGGMSGSDSDSGSAGGPLFLRAYKQSNNGMCIEEGSGCGVMEQVGKWVVCFQSAYNSGTTASLAITPSSSGVTTELNFDGCK